MLKALGCSDRRAGGARPEGAGVPLRPRKQQLHFGVDDPEKTSLTSVSSHSRHSLTVTVERMSNLGRSRATTTTPDVRARGCDALGCRYLAGWSVWRR